MRLEAPPERITAANIFFSSPLSSGLLLPCGSCLRRTRVCRAPTRASACAYGGARREAYHFLGRAGGIAANRGQLGDYADGGFFRRESAHFEGHWCVKAVSFFRAV